MITMDSIATYLQELEYETYEGDHSVGVALPGACVIFRFVDQLSPLLRGDLILAEDFGFDRYSALIQAANTWNSDFAMGTAYTRFNDNGTTSLGFHACYPIGIGASDSELRNFLYSFCAVIGTVHSFIRTHLDYALTDEFPGYEFYHEHQFLYENEQNNWEVITQPFVLADDSPDFNEGGKEANTREYVDKFTTEIDENIRNLFDSIVIPPEEDPDAHTPPLPNFMQTYNNYNEYKKRSFTTNPTEIAPINMMRLQDTLWRIGLYSGSEHDDLGATLIRPINNIIFNFGTLHDNFYIAVGFWLTHDDFDTRFIDYYLACNLWNSKNTIGRMYIVQGEEGIDVHVEHVTEVTMGISNDQLDLTTGLGIEHILVALDYISTEITGKNAVRWPEENIDAEHSQPAPLIKDMDSIDAEDSFDDMFTFEEELDFDEDTDFLNFLLEDTAEEELEEDWDIDEDDEEKPQA